MSKIICDICGTSYPDTADQCPICGCSKDFKLDTNAEAPAEEPVKAAAKPAPAKPAPAPAPVKPTRPPVYDDEDEDDEYDEDDEDEEYEEDEYEEDEYADDDDDDDDEDDDDDDDDDEEKEGRKSNAPLVILLVVIILALLSVGAFIVIKYFLPSMKPQDTQPSTASTGAPATETNEPTIPCENLALTSGGEVVLDMEGANWLINVMAVPENTTDKLVYASSDEAVAIVNEQGKVTAIGEGTAVITITCGNQSLTCTVIVDFTPETVPPTTEPEQTEAPTVPSQSTEPVETTPPEPAKIMGKITAKSLNIRASASTNANVLGTYKKDNKVEILELKTVDGEEWGRTEKGWISMQHVELESGVQNVTVTANALSIRKTPGTDGVKVGSYAKGTELIILETQKVGDTTWGRTNKGWISMDYVEETK